MLSDKTSVRNRAGNGSKGLLLIGVFCLTTVWQFSVAAARPGAAAAPEGLCVVGDWGPWTPCTRTGLHHWEHSHSRAVQQPAADCPALTETAACEAGRAPRPSDASTAAQQAISGLLINLPLAVSVGLSHPTATSNRTISITVTPELASSLAAGRQLWQQQASKTDVLLCSPFNGPVELLRAAESPVAGAQAQQQVLDTQQIAAARAAFAAAARAVASQAAARAKGRHHHSSSRNTLDAFRKAVILPGQAGTDGNRAGVLPGPAGDAAADVWWDGSDRMTAVVQAGPSMTAPAAHTATEALHDGVVNIVPWLTIQDGAPEQQQPTTPAAMRLNMTYDHSQRSATFNSVSTPAGTPSNSGNLLLSVHHHLTGIYGLDVSSSAAKDSLMRLPTAEAVVRTNAGGGVTQLGITLAGAWTQTNLSAALGLYQGQQQREQPNKVAFTFTNPMLLFNAAPAVMYVAMQTNVPSLGVSGAPATINIRPGGAAALELFEPCEPVPGLQLSDVQLHLQPDCSLAGVASGKLASTAVTALAVVTPLATAAGAGALETTGQDLSMVMTAETVGAGKLADVITIITRKDPPVQLLRSLQQSPQQQRMQFSSVTLTYQSPKARRRRGPGDRRSPNEGDSVDGGFNMVAVPDMKSAPALKQMLDAIGLNQESLTLRTSSIAGVGSSAFGLAANEPYSLQLPTPFTASGPTLLTLQYGQQTTGHVAPTDTLLTTSLEGTSTAGLLLPGLSSAIAVDLSTVTVTTPTAIVGASGQVEGASAPVTCQLGGTTIGPVAMDGLAFLQLSTLNISAKAGFQPLALQDLRLQGALTAFGVAGTAEFSANSGPVVQQDGTAAVELSAYLPSVDLPLMARSLGANISLGALNANMKSVRAQISGESLRKAATQVARPGQASGAPGLAVAAELQMLGMSSYVNFDLSGQQGAAVSASFVAGQINRALMPSLLSGLSAALRAAHSYVTAAAAGGSNQASVASLIDNAQEAVEQAQQRLHAAAATLNAANQQAVRQLQQAAATADAATAAYQTLRIQGGTALLEARNELNTADTAFNQAKTQAYKELNLAQQTYKETLKAHESFMKTAQDRMDTLMAQTLQLRAEYNAANMLCDPTPQGTELCKTAAAAWSRYQSVSAALETSQTALQEAATVGPSAQSLRAAKARFATQQAVANEVVTGAEWAAHTAATAKLQSAMAALVEAEQGRAAARMRAANDGFVHAQETSRQLLSEVSAEYTAVRDAKQALKAARAGLKAATAVGRLTKDELAAAAQDLSAVLAQIQIQAAELSRLVDTAGTSLPAAPADSSGLVRFDRINVGMTLAPSEQPNAPVLLAVSYSGAVTAGEQQQPLMGRFQVDVTDSGGEELGLMLGEVLRDDAVNAIRTAHRSLAAVL